MTAAHEPAPPDRNRDTHSKSAANMRPSSSARRRNGRNPAPLEFADDRGQGVARRRRRAARRLQPAAVGTAFSIAIGESEPALCDHMSAIAAAGSGSIAFVGRGPSSTIAQIGA